MHILSTIIIQSGQVLLKKFMLKLREMENNHFEFFQIFDF